MPQMPSQLDECGAAISTSLGMSGNAPTTRQPPRRRIVRPSQREKRRAGGTCGMFGGITGSSGGFVATLSPSCGYCARA